MTTAGPDGEIALDAARSIAAATFARARELALQPVTVAILDTGGHLVFLAREDGASIIRLKIVGGNAFTALALGGWSRQVAEVAASRPSFVASLGHFADRASYPPPVAG